jgi:sphingolipid delta-4 desaturase
VAGVSDSLRFVTHPEPHRARGRELLGSHPAIRELMGPNRWTALVGLGAAAAQIVLARAVCELPWWVGLLVAWTAGAWLCALLYAVQHELAHRLVFHARSPNRVLAIALNAPWILPVAIAYGYFHRQHHHHQGVIGLDPDLPLPFERRLARRRLGKVVWSALFPLWQTLRTMRHPRRPPVAWFVANLAFQAAADLALGYWLGLFGIGYLTASFFFSMALHPFAGRFVQEHHLLEGDASHETNSYYGVLDRGLLHIGHHREHHDFPFVAWNRLPRVRRIAPDAYPPAGACRSWTLLLWRFVTSHDLGVSSRVVRALRPSDVRERPA